MRLLILLLFCSVICKAQNVSISGIVLNAHTNQPLANVNVFINQSQISTTTNASGYYQINLPDVASVVIVFSAKNFNTTFRRFNHPFTNSQVNINMFVADKNNEEIIVRSAIKDGWLKWGTFFLKQFFGETDNGEACTMHNKEVIKFNIDKTNNTLNAYAFEPLIITNKALGYKVAYTLDKFEYNFKNTLIYIQGFTQYTDYSTEKSTKKQKKISDLRLKAYKGSVVHFMKSLYNDSVKQNDFYLVKSRIEEREVALNDNENQITFVDSNGKPIQKFKRTKKVEILDTVQLTLKDLLLLKDTTETGDIELSIGFNDRLFVQYSKELECKQYAAKYLQKPSLQKTRIYFINNASSVKLNKYGLYNSPQDLVMDGYMGYERFGDQLPIDYNFN